MARAPMRLGGSALAAALLSAVALGAATDRASAQERSALRVRVRQVAGATLYLDVGTRHGLAAGDTLDVAREEAGVRVGRLVVTASTPTRSVLSFAGAPFPVTRGEVLVLGLLRVPAELPAAADARPERAPPAADAARAPNRPREEIPVRGVAPRRPYGRIGLDLAASRSVTRVGTSDPLHVDRTFATPALRLDATVPDALGGFRLRTSLRLAYRYSDVELARPAASTRVYAAVLERDFTSLPLRVALGRFHSPVESYSGYWDGAFVRWGGDVGIGALVGFEPDRWDERPSTALPKATAFVDATRRGRGWRWSGDVSVHAVRPSDSLPDHTFVGVTQRLVAGAVRLGHDLQVDRDPEGGWRLSRLRADGALALGAGLHLRAGVARRESWSVWRAGDPFSPRHDRVQGGLAYLGAGGSLALDLSRARDAAGRVSNGATASFRLRAVPLLAGSDLTGSLSRWSGPYGTTLSLAPALGRDFGTTRLRAGYRLDRSELLGREVLTHGVEGGFDLPLGVVRASGRARVQWGSVLAAQSFRLGLVRVF